MIHVDGVSIRAGEFRVRKVTLKVPTGSYGVVMGRTGCGKTTLLEAVSGLKSIDEGRILLGERDVTRLKPAERNLGYVPQDGALFHSMSVAAHLAFALHIRGHQRQSINQRVEELAALLGLESLLKRTTEGLSGGERQRVALGRALSYRPQTLLLDEPLSALDTATRKQMGVLLKEIQAKENVTILHVTHNLEEAESLADYRFHFEDGKLAAH